MEDSLLALFGIMLFVFVIFLILFYVYTALVLMSIAKKTKQEKSWLAWIPIANLYLMTKIASAPWWITIILLVSIFIPFIGIIIVLGISVWLWWKIAEVRGKPGWWGLLMLIPIVNLIIMGVIAWSD